MPFSVKESGDAFNFYLCIVCTMSDFFTESLTTLHFKGNNLIALNKFVNDFGIYACGYISANLQGSVIIYQQYFRKSNLVSGFSSNLRNKELLTLCNLKLLPGYFYNCKHDLSYFGDAKVGLFSV